MCKDIGLVTIHCAISETPSGSAKDTTERPTVPIRSLSHLKQLYPDRFTGIGKLPGLCKLTLKDDAKPVIHPPRRVPIQLKDKIKAELDRMVSLDVIRPITEPTKWVSNITYVPKQDGSVRICLDPKDLNAALRRNPHHTPTMEELAHKFNNATVFSKLDARSGYWNICLDPESQPLTTFNTPYGRFCFKRLPFGLNISQDVFQATMDQILEGLPGVVSIADDIAISGDHDSTHDTNLHLLMQRARAVNLVFNEEK